MDIGFIAQVALILSVGLGAIALMVHTMEGYDKEANKVVTKDITIRATGGSGGSGYRRQFVPTVSGDLVYDVRTGLRKHWDMHSFWRQWRTPIYIFLLIVALDHFLFGGLLLNRLRTKLAPVKALPPGAA